MTPHDARGILDAMRTHRALTRRRRYRASKLTRYRAEIVTLHLAGASYRELALWLRRDHRLRADPTTIRRYLIQLPEVAAAKEAGNAELSQGC